MTPPERSPETDPREWLRRARSNLLQAFTKDPVVFEDRCAASQQAAEKAIKAVMVARGVEFPYVHDLARLTKILEESGEVIPETVRRAERLTGYAVLARYPGHMEPVTEQECVEARDMAEAVVRWAESQV